MPGQGDVKAPCGRNTYCGRVNCRHVALCRTLPEARSVPGAPLAARKPRRGPLAQPADVVYLYDGSLPGFYCCVHESVYARELPCGIWPEAEAPPTLYQEKLVETDQIKAQRVRASVPREMSGAVLALLEAVYLSCLAEKEIKMLRFLLLGYQAGPAVLSMMGHDDVAPMLAAEKHLGGEVHLLKGFIRFSDYDGALAATISPKNFVLPFLAGHFAARYSGENFLIFDKTHKAALVHENGRQGILPMEGIEFPQASEEEEGYRALWKQFYNTIAIEARTNPKCRMTHMPKRYWENMLEVSDLL